VSSKEAKYLFWYLRRRCRKKAMSVMGDILSLHFSMVRPEKPALERSSEINHTQMLPYPNTAFFITAGS
jgi:hypothetical protein